MRKALLAVWICAAAAHAQTVATVYVNAPQVRITSGDAVELSVVARDTAGNPVNAPNVQWSSSDSKVIQVDSRGVATAAGLGLADVTAATGGRSGVIRLQVLPQRIEVSPENAVLKFRAQQQFTAVAYNSRNEPIPNTVFSWRIMVGGGTGNSATISISQDGSITAQTLGYYVVRASIVYANTPDQFEREFAGSTLLRIVPGDYRITELVSSSISFPSFRLRGSRASISANDSGLVAFPAALDGMSGALMTAQNSSINVLATLGSQGLMPGTIVWDFQNASLDNNGNVLTTERMIGSNTNVVLAGPSGPLAIIPDRALADTAVDVTSMYTSRFSLSDSGQFVVRGNFHYDDSTVNYMGLMRYAEGFMSLEVSSRDPLPGLTGNISFDNEFGIDGQGVIYFAANAGSNRAIYRKESSKAPVKVVAFGDKVNGSAVTDLSQIAVAQGGDLIVRANLASGAQVFLSYPTGSPGTVPILMTSNYINALYNVNHKGGVVWAGDGGSGYGLYLGKTDGSSQLLLSQFSPGPTGEPIAEFYSAAVDAFGNVYATVRGLDSPWMLVQLTGSPSLIAGNGTFVPSPANLNLYTVPVLGDKVGPLHVLAGGDSASIFQADNLGLIPTVLSGDRLPGGYTYQGNLFPRKTPSGDLYVTNDNATVRLSSAGNSLIASYPYLFPDGVRMYAPFNLAVNDRNQALLVAGTDRSHQRLALFSGKALRSIAYFGGGPPFQTASPGGGIFAGLNDFAISDTGQAMIAASVNGGPGGLFLYDGSAWQTVCLYGTCKIDGETITGANNLRATNNNFCALLVSTNTRVACFDRGTWTTMLKRGDVSSDGTEISGVNSFDVNRRGDIAVIANTNFGGPNVFLKTTEGFFTVQSGPFPFDDGNYLVSTYSVDLRDDRRVFYIAQDSFGRMVAYAADPLF